VLLWTARILAATLVLFVGLFIIGYAINPQGDGSPPGLPEFALFPIGVMVGLALGWRWQLLGGIVTAACMVVFLVLMGESLLETPIFAVFLVPAVLFIIYALVSRKHVGGELVEGSTAE
jgi:hypothetical protein